MEIIFKEGEWYKQIPEINEDVFISYDLKITKNNFKYLYEKTIEIANSTEYNVFTYYNNVKYILNPKFDYKDDVSPIELYNSTKNNINAIKNKQAIFLKKLKIINSLQKNHEIELLSQKRSLEKEDLKDYFSWKPNVVIIPSLFESDLIGVQGLVRTKEDDAYAIKTSNVKGIAIPVRHLNGNIYKYQIKQDMTKGTVKLKAKTKDDITVIHSEYSSLNNYRQEVYHFEDDYAIVKSNYTGIVIKNLDTEETLETYLGEDITHFFKGVPPIIDRLYTEMKAKYIWIPRGNMIPDDDFGHKLTHVENTYIQSKLTDEPCIVVLTEGILKGEIINKHLKDKNIVTIATPGIAKASLNEVIRSLKHFKVKTVYIAYDTDASKNRLVTEALSYLYQKLYKTHITYILTWDPKYKGLDDYILNNQNWEFRKGNPKECYPIAELEYPYPYHIDGTRATKLEWQIESDNKRSA